MNLHKTLLACVLGLCVAAVGASPALANDTATVISVPNLSAVAQAMNAATNQLNNGGPGVVVEEPDVSVVEPAVMGRDYVSLDEPAVYFSGELYLPLRNTFASMKGNQALDLVWKADGQQIIRLVGHAASYEVWLTPNSDGLQLAPGAPVYPLESLGGVTYVPLTFFRDIMGACNVKLASDRVLEIESQVSANVWTSADGFWTNMVPMHDPAEDVVVEFPEIFMPEVDAPVVIGDAPAFAGGTGVISDAMEFLGVPYVYGGASPSGFDCSGFVQYVFALNGISLPRTSYDQQAAVTPVRLDSLQPGDLVFWGSSAYHVGIYIGGGKYIHATVPGDSVRIQSVDEYAFTSAGRVVQQ